MVKRHYIWHPFTFVRGSFEKITSQRFHNLYSCFVGGKGIYLYDINNKKYLNTCSTLWNINLGLGQKAIVEASSAQLKKLAFHSLFRSSHLVAEKYASELVKLMPGGLEAVFFSNSGSEAIETAIKAVRQYFACLGHKHKTQIVHLKGAYHGVTYGALSCSDKEGYEIYAPFLPGFEEILNPYCYRCPLGLSFPKCKLKCALKLKELSLKNNQVAAIIIEPIQGDAGIISPPPGYLKTISRICKEKGILLIFDEVTTGFGRTGYPFAFNLFKVKPDIICLSKGINSGYLPMGVTVFSREIYNVISKKNQVFLHGSTQAGNPVSCAAALVVLSYFKNKKFLERIKSNGRFLKESIAKQLGSLEIVGDIRGEGFMVGVELVRNKETKMRLSQEKIAILEEILAKHGLFTYINNSVLYLMPPITIAKKEIKKMMDKFRKALIEFET